MPRNTFEEIKKIVFAKRVGECHSDAEWQKFYAEGGKALPVDHLTSCAQCLDTVNRLLGLPTLNERHPFDTINRDTDNEGPFSSSGNGGKSGSGDKTDQKIDPGMLRQRLEQARNELFACQPEEITFCINGWPLASRRVEAGSNTLTVRPQVEELLENLELLDEKGRLLYHLSIEEECATGNDGDWPDLSLSPHQKLNLTVTWIDDYPEINLQYSDLRLSEAPLQKETLSQKISGWLPDWRAFLSMRWLMMATTAAILVITIALSAVFVEISRRQRINSLERELEASKLERQELERQLGDEKARRLESEKERERIAGDLQNLEKKGTTGSLESGEDLKLAVAKISLRLLVSADDTSTATLNNTRAILAPIALPRGEQTRLTMRLPRYDDGQTLFKSYLLDLSIPGRAPITARLSAPETTKDPLFFVLEAVIGNTSKLAPNTRAEATVFGIIGQRRVPLGSVPLILE